MLILRRKLGEEIVISHNITVKVVKILDGQVFIGIDAPREVPVHRAEVQRNIDAKEVKP